MCLWTILVLEGAFHGEKAKLCRQGTCTARAVSYTMGMLQRSGLPAKCHGPLPLELVGKGPPSIAQVIVIVPWFCDCPKQGWRCQLSQRGLYPTWGKWSELCSQRLYCVRRCTGLFSGPESCQAHMCVNALPWDSRSAHSQAVPGAWRFLGWVTC